jgi:hypothetical protein
LKGFLFKADLDPAKEYGSVCPDDVNATFLLHGQLCSKKLVKQALGSWVESSVLAGDSELQCMPRSCSVNEKKHCKSVALTSSGQTDPYSLAPQKSFKSKRLYMRRLAKERLKTLVLLGTYPDVGSWVESSVLAGDSELKCMQFGCSSNLRFLIKFN